MNPSSRSCTLLTVGVLVGSLANSAFARTVVAWAGTPAAAAGASSATSRLPLVVALLLWSLVAVVAATLARYAKRSHQTDAKRPASVEAAPVPALTRDGATERTR